MKYKDLIDNASKLEEEYELTECIYFGAIEKLGEVQEDISKIDDVKHIRRIIRLFLINWGMMNRVVGRKDLEWKKLGETLRSLEKEFRELRDRKFLTTNFNENTISNAIRTIYGKLDPFPYLGSPTTLSKILHLLNPEIFVMWDNEIVKKYKKRNFRVSTTAEGYLEFLKDAQKEIKEALNDHQKESGKQLDEIEKELRARCDNRTLARIVDEYNWMITR
jgi:hypothetical protein